MRAKDLLYVEALKRYLTETKKGSSSYDEDYKVVLAFFKDTPEHLVLKDVLTSNRCRS
jgi:hypothetical protein